MLTLTDLAGALPPRPDPATLLAGFVPPPRFESATFATYVPDPAYPSQGEAVERLRRFRTDSAGRAGWRRWFGSDAPGRQPIGVYLDGGFGVGKTHLLAAVWHASEAPRAYLSFDELVSTLGWLGIDQASRLFERHRLVAIDEWELDDPGNLKLALAFLRRMVAARVPIATTSNTVPVELGRGRFSQKDFASEIEELAAAFEVVRVEGEDYRHRRYEAAAVGGHFVTHDALRELGAALTGAVLAPFDEVLRVLRDLHPIRYEELVRPIELLLVDGIAPFTALPDALRWVHLVDKLYDDARPLRATSAAPLPELFPESFVTGAYGKKFSRCLSRLSELLVEPLPA